MFVLSVASHAAVSQGLLALDTSATEDRVTDSSASTDAASALGLSGPPVQLRVTVYSGDLDDPNHDTAERVAEKRFKDGISDLVFPILKIEDIHELLQSYAYFNKLQPAERVQRFEQGAGIFLVPDDDPGFVKHLSIIGHGSAGSTTKEAFYSFGEVAYRTSELGEMRQNGLDLSRYMIENGTLVLEGCQAGLGEPGRLFLFQIGRIFFGKKKGVIIANTTSSMGIAGEIVGGNPRKLHWPRDWADYPVFQHLPRFF